MWKDRCRLPRSYACSPRFPHSVRDLCLHRPNQKSNLGKAKTRHIKACGTCCSTAPVQSAVRFLWWPELLLPCLSWFPNSPCYSCLLPNSLGNARTHLSLEPCETRLLPLPDSSRAGHHHPARSSSSSISDLSDCTSFPHCPFPPRHCSAAGRMQTRAFGLRKPKRCWQRIEYGRGVSQAWLSLDVGVPRMICQCDRALCYRNREPHREIYFNKDGLSFWSTIRGSRNSMHENPSCAKCLN